MSRHNRFLEEHGCLAVLIIAVIIIVVVVFAYYWVRHGLPVFNPWIIKK